MRRTHFEELDVLDQAHLDFLTAYDKQYLFEGRPAEAARLRTMGTVVGKHGIVVGYTSDGWERCLFEMEGEDVLLKTRNLRKRRSAPSVTLWKKASDYLMQNRFRLQTAEQRACYHQWLKTGRFSVEQAWKEIHQKEAEKMATEERRRMEQTHAEIRRQAIRSRRRLRIHTSHRTENEQTCVRDSIHTMQCPCPKPIPSLGRAFPPSVELKRRRE